MNHKANSEWSDVNTAITRKSVEPYETRDMDLEHENKVKKISMNGFRKWIALAGAIMIFFPEHVLNVWGNMSVYITSYFHVKHGIISVESPWSLAAFTVGKNLGSNIPGYLTCVNRNVQLFFGIFIFNAGISSIYFILEGGITIILFVVFGIIGLCAGVLDSVVLKILSDISGSSRGAYISVACSGFTFGPFLINYFVGFYINPENLDPNVDIDEMSLFGQPELINKVPYMVVILSVSYGVCMFTGFCLLLLSTLSAATNASKEVRYESLPTKEDSDEFEILNQESNETFKTTLNNEFNSEQEMTDTSTAYEDDSSSVDSEYDHDKLAVREFTPRQALGYMPFYVICFCYGSGLFPYLLMSGWYKTFGLVYIKDDHLLTKLGSCISLVGGIGRICWGFALDRITIKTCQVMICSYLSLTVLLMYFAVTIDQYFYFAVTISVGFGCFIVLTTYLIVALDYFGESNFYKIYGMLCLTRVFFGLIIPPLFESLRDYFGWFGPFCCTSVFSIVSLILTVFIVPNIPKRKRK